MAKLRFADISGLTPGEERLLHYQELNPPDRSKPELLDLRWRHDHVEGDLAFGSLHISGMGALETDAFIYRDAVTNPVREYGWLSGIDLPSNFGGPGRYMLTGGPLHIERLLPSEVAVRSYRPMKTSGQARPAVVPFSPSEFTEVGRWLNGMREKGFACNVPPVSYVEYKHTLLPSLSARLENNGLDCALEVRRLRTGFFRSAYNLTCIDYSFRSPTVNKLIHRARPRATLFVHETCSTFDELLRCMDHGLDDLVVRNKKHLSQT